MMNPPASDLLRAANVAVIAVDMYRPHLKELSLALPPIEFEEANRFARREDAERFIISRGLLRHLCAAEVGVEPRAITFGRGPRGKPCLGSGSGLNFNVSHSGNCVILAWSTSGALGVDVEAAEPHDRQTFLEMAKQVFSAEEIDLLISTDRVRLPEIFYRIWVRKEAVAKADGIGVGGVLRSFSVATDSSGSISWCEKVRFPPDAATWAIHDLRAPAGHVASLAVPEGTAVEECGSLLQLLRP
jgi:4'-phosphopantetheinyl transferase